MFDIAQFDVQLTPAVLHATLGRGLLSPQIYTSRQQVFGASKDVLAYPLWRMVLEEIADPFYVFQLLSVALWIWDDYLEYAYVVLILMVVSSYYEIRNARYVLLEFFFFSRISERGFVYVAALVKNVFCGFS